MDAEERTRLRDLSRQANATRAWLRPWEEAFGPDTALDLFDALDAAEAEVKALRADVARFGDFVRWMHNMYLPLNDDGSVPLTKWVEALQFARDIMSGRTGARRVHDSLGGGRVMAKAEVRILDLAETQAALGDAAETIATLRQSLDSVQQAERERDAARAEAAAFADIIANLSEALEYRRGQADGAREDATRLRERVLRVADDALWAYSTIDRNDPDMLTGLPDLLEEISDALRAALAATEPKGDADGR